MRKSSLLLLLIVPMLAGAAATAPADEPDPFVQAVAEAYPNYRMAWFYTRTGNGDVAALEVEAFRDAWAAIVQRFGDAPPSRYAADRQWRQSLATIRRTLDRCLSAIEAGRVKQTHRTLGTVRSGLAALRRRSGVVVFSDHVDAYGALVAELSDLRRKMKQVTPAHLETLARLAADMRQAVAVIAREAPSEYRNNPGFMASIEGNYASIGKLDRGLANRHLRAIKGSVSSIRGDYVLLFVRYG